LQQGYKYSWIEWGDEKSDDPLASFLPCTPRSFSCGLAKLLPREIDYGETPMFLWQSLEISLNEYLNGFFAGINFDTHWRVAEINLMSATVLSSEDGMGHIDVAHL
jgi:hypothetical protein